MEFLKSIRQGQDRRDVPEWKNITRVSHVISSYTEVLASDIIQTCDFRSNTEIDIIVQANISWSTTIIFFVVEPCVPERYTVGGGNDSFT